MRHCMSSKASNASRCRGRRHSPCRSRRDSNAIRGRRAAGSRVPRPPRAAPARWTPAPRSRPSTETNGPAVLHRRRGIHRDPCPGARVHPEIAAEARILRRGLDPESGGRQGIAQPCRQRGVAGVERIRVRHRASLRGHPALVNEAVASGDGGEKDSHPPDRTGLTGPEHGLLGSCGASLPESLPGGRSGNGSAARGSIPAVRGHLRSGRGSKSRRKRLGPDPDPLLLDDVSEQSGQGIHGVDARRSVSRSAGRALPPHR